MACIRLPQGLAYGALANVPPIHGLYTELFSCFAYAPFATSRHNSVGTFAVVALMSGSMIDEYIPKEYLHLSANSTALDEIKAGVYNLYYVYTGGSIRGPIDFVPKSLT